MLVYYCMEKVVLNKTHDYREWANRELLFGISPEMDKLLTENFVIVGRLVADSLIEENFGFGMVYDEVSQQCYCCFLNLNREKLINFLRGDDYRAYDRTIKEICKIVGWEHESVKLTEIEIKDANLNSIFESHEDPSMETKTFADYVPLWDRATPVLGV